MWSIPGKHGRATLWSATKSVEGAKADLRQVDTTRVLHVLDSFFFVDLGTYRMVSVQWSGFLYRSIGRSSRHGWISLSVVSLAPKAEAENLGVRPDR
jgi:hypothetical protein